MAERPILFSAPMVRALLAGTKTQTRRVVKLPHQNPLGQWEPTRFGGPNGGRTKRGETIPEQGGIWHTRTGDHLGCPHGHPGDRLWVREAWARYRSAYGKPVYRADPEWVGVPSPQANGRWRPSIHMPRHASRITLEVTGVRVERLQDISEADSIAEGIHKPLGSQFWHTDPGANILPGDTPVWAYRNLWESINGPGAWDANPFVWVVEFKRVEA